MGVGTLRRYHYKDKLQAIADKLKELAAEIERLKYGNELDKQSFMESIAKASEIVNAMKELKGD